MASYLNQNGNSIGSLLRFIQEQKSQSPMVPPGTETGSPIRGIVQEPLKAPEDVGTSKVVSLKPEAVIGASQGPAVGQEAAMGMTPQRTAFGWSGMGGTPVGPAGAAANVVAANEPGKGQTIPSATRTMGDVVNKTGAASGTPPALGTAIKVAAPTTTKGSTVQQVNRTFDTAGLEKTTAATKAAIEAGDRSFAETQSRQAELDRQAQELLASVEAERRKVEADRAVIAYASNPTSENYKKYKEAIAATSPSPTPTPAPQQPQQQQAPKANQSYGTSTVPSYSAPSTPSYSQPKQSTPAPAPQPSKPSVQQTIASIITKSPWSWLFGR